MYNLSCTCSQSSKTVWDTSKNSVNIYRRDMSSWEWKKEKKSVSSTMWWCGCVGILWPEPTYSLKLQTEKESSLVLWTRRKLSIKASQLLPTQSKALPLMCLISQQRTMVFHEATLRSCLQKGSLERSHWLSDSFSVEVTSNLESLFYFLTLSITSSLGVSLLHPGLGPSFWVLAGHILTLPKATYYCLYQWSIWSLWVLVSALSLSIFNFTVLTLKD